MSTWYDMDIEDLSKLIGNKQKATDIYNDTGAWDSGLNKQNTEIRNKYGITDDIDLNAANSIFNQRMNTMNSLPKSNDRNTGNASGNNLFNMAPDNSTYTGNAKNTNNLNIYESEWRPVQRNTVKNQYDLIYGDGGKGFLDGISDNEMVRGLTQNLYDEGEKAYKSNISGINSYAGGKNTWSERIASDSRNDYAKQAANVVPQYAQMYLNQMNTYDNRLDNLDVTDNQNYRYSQDRADTQTQQDFANQYAISGLMGGATSGLRQYANPYFNQDGSLKNADTDYQAMINELDVNDPNYDQKKYQLEQARFTKVQDPKYSQYAQGVTAPVQSAPIWNASSNNPEIKAQQIANWLTETYKPSEYEAAIAGLNLDNDTKRLLNYYLPREKEAGITAQEKQNARYDDIVDADIYAQRTNANANATSARKSGSSKSGSTKEVKPDITVKQSIDNIKKYMGETTTEKDKYNKDIKVQAHTMNDVIDYAMGLEGLGYDLDYIENVLLPNAGVPASAVKEWADKKEYDYLSQQPPSMGNLRKMEELKK